MYQVLLVDDEILVRDAIRERINWNSLGYELAGDCQNGKEAIEFVKNHPVDVVLTDICMPYVDGMELSHYLHDHYPDILIIIFSGFGEFEYAKKAIQYKVSEYLLKPITAVELTEVLTRMKEKLESAKKEEIKLKRLTSTSNEYIKNQQIIQSQVIHSLVTCCRQPAECMQELERMGIRLDKATDYRVAVICIDLYSGMYEQKVSQRQESALMAFVVYNISSELVNDFDCGIAYQEPGNRVGILFKTNKPIEFLHTVETLCKEIQKQVYDAMKLEISISVGKYVKSLTELHTSYDQAEAALDYRYLLGGRQYLDLEKDDGFEKEIILYEELEELSRSIQKNDKNAMSDILDKIREKIIQSRTNRSRVCIYLQQILRAISGVVEKVHPDPRKVQEKRHQLLNQITEKRTFQQAMDLVVDFAREAMEYMENEKSSSSKRQAIEAMEYIQERYADQNLSLNSICSYLGISTSYFSTIFKETTGETFMEFLIRTRMEKAKQLLENTTLKNYEIAERVGFADPHYFGISFKKITGMTPTAYAKEKRR